MTVEEVPPMSLKQEHFKGTLTDASSATYPLCVLKKTFFMLENVWVSVFKLRSENKQRNMKHTTENVVIQPSDRFVCRAYMSQQLVLILLTAMLCLGVRFPLITWLGEIRQEGKGGRVGLGERVRWRFSRFWQAVDSWTTGSSFSSRRGWNFSPWKSRVINDWGSQNNLSVWFLSRPFLIFPVPVPSPWPQLGSDGRWYDSKCDYVKIFYSKRGQMVKNSLRNVSIMLNQQGSQLFWAQRGSRGWDYSLTAAAVFFLIWSQPSSHVFQSLRFWGSEKCWWDSCVAALVQLKWVTTGWSKALAWPWTWLGKWEQGDSKDTVSWASTWTHKQGLVILHLCVFFSLFCIFWKAFSNLTYLAGSALNRP